MKTKFNDEGTMENMARQRAKPQANCRNSFDPFMIPSVHQFSIALGDEDQQIRKDDVKTIKILYRLPIAWWAHISTYKFKLSLFSRCQDLKDG